jgi:hypothetical protein
MSWCRLAQSFVELCAADILTAERGAGEDPRRAAHLLMHSAVRLGLAASGSDNPPRISVGRPKPMRRASPPLPEP